MYAVSCMVGFSVFFSGHLNHYNTTLRGVEIKDQGDDILVVFDTSSVPKNIQLLEGPTKWINGNRCLYLYVKDIGTDLAVPYTEKERIEMMHFKTKTREVLEK